MGSSCSSESSAAVKRAGAPDTLASGGKALKANGIGTVVFVRHGESEWNKANRFTGWVDVGLTARGKEEALEAGQRLKEAGIVFDEAHTSVLKRAIRTCNIILEEVDQLWIPVSKDYRLNERMYGGLAGLNKQETVEEHGIDQVMLWRRSYDTLPPKASVSGKYHPRQDGKYAHLGIAESNLPSAESLKTTLDRVLPYWMTSIVPSVEGGKTVLVAAHGNSIRAILKFIDKIPESVVTGINIPTGTPLVYQFNTQTMEPLRQEGAAEHLSGRYLVSEEELAERLAQVTSQTKG